MQVATPAIMLMPHAEGWVWELVDADGMTTIAGVSSDQVEAMQSAWSAARSQSGAGSHAFPDIVIDHRAG